MSALLSLAVFSGLSMNLILHFALGLRGAAAEEAPSLPLFQTGVLFLSSLLLWVLFFYILVPLGLGFIKYPALFPFSVLMCCGLEHLFTRICPAARSASRPLRAIAAYDGLTVAAVFIILSIAASFVEALVLSLGFSLGILLAIFLTREIRLRSALEAVPPLLRGTPLSLISLGLLSLIFSCTAAVLFRVFGVF